MKRSTQRDWQFGIDVGSKLLSLLTGLYGIYNADQQRAKSRDVYNTYMGSQTVTPAEPIATTDPTGKAISMPTFNTTVPNQVPMTADRLAALMERYAAAGVEPTYSEPFMSVARTRYDAMKVAEDKAEKERVRNEEKANKDLAAKQKRARDYYDLGIRSGMTINPDVATLEAIAEALQTGGIATSIPNPEYKAPFDLGAQPMGPADEATAKSEIRPVIPTLLPKPKDVRYQFGQEMNVPGMGVVVPVRNPATGEVEYQQTGLSSATKLTVPHNTTARKPKNMTMSQWQMYLSAHQKLSNNEAELERVQALSPQQAMTEGILNVGAYRYRLQQENATLRTAMEAANKAYPELSGNQTQDKPTW